MGPSISATLLCATRDTKLSAVRGSHILLTFQLRYPRFIHAQVLMHRMFARNAASNRARSLPTFENDAQFEAALENELVFYPRPRKRNKGMKVTYDVTDHELQAFPGMWKDAARVAYDFARRLQSAGYAKEIVNRLIEPFQMIDVVMTGTYQWWEHFIALRIKDDAQWEIAELARLIHSALPKPELVGHRQPDTKLVFHIPYVSQEERDYLYEYFENDPDFSVWAACAVSSARCARVSYTPFDELKPNIHKDLDLFRKLVSAQPMHASPLEHAAISQHGEVWRALSGPQTIHAGWSTFRAIWENAPSYQRDEFFELYDAVGE